MIKRTIAAAACGLLLLAGSRAHAVAEAGVPSLTIPPGARANGMGEAYVALSDDATAAWWNPGGLAFVGMRNLAFMHSQLVPDLASDVYYEFLGYTHEVSKVGTLALSFIYLTYGENVATDTQGIEQGKFTSWEGSINGSFAMPLGDNIGVGLSMKFIHVDYAPAQFTVERQEGAASSFAVDAGALWKFPSKRLNLGLAITNMGPDIAFIDREQADPLPITARLGAGWTAVADDVSNLLLAADIEQSLVWLVDGSTSTRRSEIWHGGVEYRYVNLLAGRFGWIYDQDGDFNAATYGLGFIYKDRLSLDYANVPQAETLDRVHRWSIYFKF